VSRMKITTGLAAALLIAGGVGAALAAGEPSESAVEAQAAAHDEVNPAGHTRGWASHGSVPGSEAEAEAHVEASQGPSDRALEAQAAAHAPVNPAGKTRGWAKEHGPDQATEDTGPRGNEGGRPSDTPFTPTKPDGSSESHGAGNAHGGNPDASERARSGNVRDDG
jgi:hypothetical protein